MLAVPGRADYLSVAADGSVKGWLNKPKNSDGGGIAWAQIGDGTTGSVALGAGLGPTVRFADVDGDGLVRDGVFARFPASATELTAATGRLSRHR